MAEGWCPGSQEPCLALALETGLKVTLQISRVFHLAKSSVSLAGPMTGMCCGNLGGLEGILAVPVTGFNKRSPL